MPRGWEMGEMGCKSSTGVKCTCSRRATSPASHPHPYPAHTYWFFVVWDGHAAWWEVVCQCLKKGTKHLVVYLRNSHQSMGKLENSYQRNGLRACIGHFENRNPRPTLRKKCSDSLAVQNVQRRGREGEGIIQISALFPVSSLFLLNYWFYLFFLNCCLHLSGKHKVNHIFQEGDGRERLGSLYIVRWATVLKTG